MEDVGAVKIKRPIALRNKSFNVDGKGFLQGIFKTGLSFLTRDYQATGEGMMETASSLGLAKEPGVVAWLLLARSLESAVIDLLKDNQELMYQGQVLAKEQVYTVSLTKEVHKD